MDTENEIKNADFIIADTGVWMEMEHSGPRLFENRLKGYLEKYDKTVLIPDACRLELKKHIQGNDPEKARQAEHGLRLVIDLYSQGRLSVHEDGSSRSSLRDDGFADPFIRDAAQDLFQYGNVLVLLQDKKLCWDLLTHRSVSSRYYIHVASVSQYGWLKKPKTFYDWLDYEKKRREEEKKRQENGGALNEN